MLMLGKPKVNVGKTLCLCWEDLMLMLGNQVVYVG